MNKIGQNWKSDKIENRTKLKSLTKIRQNISQNVNKPLNSLVSDLLLTFLRPACVLYEFLHLVAPFWTRLRPLRGQEQFPLPLRHRLRLHCPCPRRNLHSRFLWHVYCFLSFHFHFEEALKNLLQNIKIQNFKIFFLNCHIKG